jgi:hypothetical protein
MLLKFVQMLTKNLFVTLNAFYYCLLECMASVWRQGSGNHDVSSHTVPWLSFNAVQPSVRWLIV